MYFYLSDRGNPFNEDFVFITETYGILLDGATGLYNEKLSNGNTDAQVFSHHIGKLLCENIDNLSMSLPEIITECLKEVHQEYFNVIEDLEDNRLPSATLSCFRRNREKLEIVTLGDSPIIIKTKNNFYIYLDEILNRNETQVINNLLVEWEKTKNFDKAKENIHPFLIKLRESKNAVDGYKVLDFSSKGIKGYQVISFDYKEVDEILLVSDGIYRLVDTFHLYTEQELLMKLNNYTGSLLLVDKLRKLENQENSLKKYPRLKISDDASIGYWAKDKER